jgi:hypothetical protein
MALNINLKRSTRYIGIRPDANTPPTVWVRIAALEEDERKAYTSDSKYSHGDLWYTNSVGGKESSFTAPASPDVIAMIRKIKGDAVTVVDNEDGTFDWSIVPGEGTGLLFDTIITLGSGNGLTQHRRDNLCTFTGSEYSTSAADKPGQAKMSYISQDPENWVREANLPTTFEDLETVPLLHTNSTGSYALSGVNAGAPINTVSAFTWTDEQDTDVVWTDDVTPETVAEKQASESFTIVSLLNSQSRGIIDAIEYDATGEPVTGAQPKRFVDEGSFAVSYLKGSGPTSRALSINVPSAYRILTSVPRANPDGGTGSVTLQCHPNDHLGTAWEITLTCTLDTNLTRP